MPTLNVEGMTCAHCERAVTDAIHRIDAGAQVNVDLAAGTVKTDSPARMDELADAIRAEGYRVQLLVTLG